MEIVLMGTACADAGADRDNTYLLARERDGCTMIDAGGNPLSKLKKLGVALDEIKRVVFTHFHIDHIYGFPSLLWGMWIGGRTEPLHVYCPQTESTRLEQWLRVMGVEEWPIRFELKIHAYDWQQQTELWRNEQSRWSVFPGLHGVPSAGLKAVHQGKVMVYSSDSKVNPAIKAIGAIDLLIHECTTAAAVTKTHSSLRQIEQFYDWRAVGRTVFVHLTEGEPYEDVWTALSAELRSKAVFGHDLMKLHL